MKRTPLKRHTPLKQVGPKRAARARAAFGKQAALCRTLPCAACGHPAPSEPAHVVSRGAGGKDRGNVIPLCGSDPRTGHEGCHQLQHQRGWCGIYMCPLVPALSQFCRAGWDEQVIGAHAHTWAQGLARGLELRAYGGWE